MENKTIQYAIRNKCIVKFTYQGYPRVVEPHAYGTTSTGEEVIRCYQIGGTSSSGKVPGWRLMEVSQIKSLVVTEEHFSGGRIGYRRGDRGMSTIFCEL